MGKSNPTQNGSKIRVLVVDDSVFVRQMLTTILNGDPEIEVIGVAKNGEEAIQKVEELSPDVVTLDIEMPIMGGLEALRIIMDRWPIPVIMFSSLTTDGASETMKALELGAVDFLAKSAGPGTASIDSIRRELLGKVKAVGSNALLRMRMPTKAFSSRTMKGFDKPLIARDDVFATPSNRIFKPKLVLIGISTGGPKALTQILPSLPSDFPLPIVIVQHMPPKFTSSLADRLNQLCSLTVKEAQDGDRLEAGNIFIAPGGKQLHIKRGGNLIVEEADPHSLYQPSIDTTLSSAIQVYGKDILGVMMTGMGRDGFEAMDELSKLGGRIIAQNEETCIVFGMPCAVIEAGIANSVVPLENIVECIEADVMSHRSQLVPA